MMAIFTGNGELVCTGMDSTDLLEMFVEALNNGEATSHYDVFEIDYDYKPDEDE